MAFYLKFSYSELSWIFGHNLWFSNSVYFLYRNGSKVKDTVKIKDVWCFIDHRKSQAWELSADKSGKRVFLGNLWSNIQGWNQRGVCFSGREREYCATAKKGHAQPNSKPHSWLECKVIRADASSFFHLPVSSVNKFYGELPQNCKKKRLKYADHQDILWEKGRF